MDSNTGQKLRILSYNVGLLRFRVMGVIAFSNPPYAHERFPQICDELANFEDVDVICLQECYEDYHANVLIEKLKSKYPYHARVHSGNYFLKFHNGLLTFSKHPISDISLQPLNKVASLERYLASKSNLICTVDVPDAGKFTVINMHTTAGGVTHPEDGDVDADRDDEIDQAWGVCQQAMAKGVTPLIVGDLNCGPEASVGNLRNILARGFRDTFAEMHPETATPATGVLPSPPADAVKFTSTWDPKNYLNAIGPHSDCPQQRCDHILVPTKTSAAAGAADTEVAAASRLDDWKVSKAEIVFTAPCVQLAQGDVKSTLSDHYGLLIELSK